MPIYLLMPQREFTMAAGKKGMNQGGPCPDADRLAAHARLELSPPDAAHLDAHLAQCAACLESYLSLIHQPHAPSVPGCRVVQEIGRGRFGVVYKAWWTDDRPRLAALKVLSSAGDMERGRFEREIAVLRRIDSPGIVKCLHWGQAGEATYYVMDYVRGLHLDEYISTCGDDWRRKLAVFQQVCRAVADAHAAGVVHRDLKPKNILVDEQGQPHVLDFGICTVPPTEWESWTQATLTQTGDIIGTLRYMSPEQAWGGVAGPADRHSDVWALGIMLHEIVTRGGYPYSLSGTADKPPHEALLDRIRKELPRLPRLDGPFDEHTARALEVLLERCLAWEPARRIDSAGQLAEDLERLHRGERILARPHSLAYRARRLAYGVAARSRWVFSAAFIALTGVALWAVTLLFNVGWLVDGHRAGAVALAGSAAEAPSARDMVLVVGVGDDTVTEVVSWATGQGLDEVTDDVTTWRRVHARLMHRLVNARPRAVAWDYYFRTPQPGDEAFAAACRQLEEAGVPVILAALRYDAEGQPQLSPGILSGLGERLRHGAIIARDMVRRPGEFVVAVQRGPDRMIPSLPLTAAAAMRFPESRLEIDWPTRHRPLTFHYRLDRDAYRRERDELELTRAYHAGTQFPLLGENDLLACGGFPLEDPDEWSRRAQPYERLLHATDDELREWARGRLVLVGDMRTRATTLAPDRHRVSYGGTIREEVPGVYLLGDAIAGLLDRRFRQSAFPLLPSTFLSLLLLAAIGSWLPMRLSARGWLPGSGQPWAWVGVIALIGGSAALAVLGDGFIIVHAGLAGAALMLPLAGSLWVEQVRHRHRVLDRSRQAIERLTLPGAGTLTIRSRPGTPLPES